MVEKFYITHAIAYPNGRPHIGHAYEAIASDAIARFHRLCGKDVRLVSGTDEHGLKMAQSARAAGQDTFAYATEMHNYFRQMGDRLNISYDAFRRTTEEEHKAACVALWNAMKESGDLYLDHYEGWYSVRDEAFYDATELREGEGGEKLSPQGTPVTWTVEESWFFRLSRYRDYLIERNESPGFLEPESRRNEVLAFLKGHELRDLSVSRTSFDWGVPVPDSPGHVMYVWVDALTTYLTGVGFPDTEGSFTQFWPADLHVIGKDIVRFHAVYWPAFLKSAGLELPKKIFGHGFLLHRGEKMSKSLGNVVDPLELAEYFGVDALRYFLLREVSFGQDGSFSAQAIVTRCNAELANSFGNLAQRTLSLIFKNLNGELPKTYKPESADLNQDDKALVDSIFASITQGMLQAFEAAQPHQAIEVWMQGVFACNAYIDAQAPWALRKTDPQRMEAVLGTLFHCIAGLAVAITPVIPETIERLLDMMGIPPANRSFQGIAGNWYTSLAQSGFRLSQPTGLFPRLELPVEVEG